MNNRRQRRRAAREAALRASAETANALAQSAIARIQQGAGPTQQKTDDNQDKGRTFLGIAIGQWIAAAAIAGCNILINRVSPSTFSIYFAVTTISLWVCWVTWKIWVGWRSMVWILCVFSFFATHKYIQFESKSSGLNDRASFTNIDLKTSQILSNEGVMPDIISAKVIGLMTGSAVTEYSNKWRQAENARTMLGRPRELSALQIEYFIRILGEPHNVSKISIPIILEGTNEETIQFVIRFAKMLRTAGYGTSPMDKLFPRDITAFKGNAVMYSTNHVPEMPDMTGVDVQPITGEVKIIAGTNSEFMEKIKPLRWADVIAFYGSDDTNNLPSVGIFYPTDPDVLGPELYTYRPTDNPNDVLTGVCDVLSYVGIRVARMSAKPWLKPGEVAFFIPN